MASRLADYFYGIIFGLLGSSCCIIQLILNSFSLGCAGFSILTPYRPYFLALTVFVITAMIYRNGLSKSAIYVTLLTACLSLTPEMLQFVNHNYFGSSNMDASAMEVFEFSIEGMRCEACANRIKSELAAQNGVIQSSIYFSDQKAVVETEVLALDGSMLINIIQKLDDSYKVKLLNSYKKSKEMSSFDSSPIIEPGPEIVRKSLKLEIFQFEVKGMHCNDCAVNIQNTLKSSSGVIDARVSFILGTAIITTVPNVFQAKSLVKVIQNVDESYVVDFISSHVEDE